jgi:hypothetical protein
MNKSKIVLLTALAFMLVLVPAFQVKVVDGADALDHFEFGVVGSPQTEEIAFTISIWAKDAYGNTVDTYSGTNTLSVSFGIISPASTTAFTGGLWTGKVTVSQHSDSGITIFTSGEGKSGTSNTFKVDKNPENLVVDYFEFDVIGSPQMAGNSFMISITAKDKDGDTVTGYNGENSLSASVGTITPSSITFSNGNWMERVTVSQSGEGFFISTGGQGKSGTSNTFKVDPNSGFVNILIVIVAAIAIVIVAVLLAYKKIQRRPKKPSALARYPRSSKLTHQFISYGCGQR